MKEKLSTYIDVAKGYIGDDARRFAVIEGNQDCNRRDSCGYCDVPKYYDSFTELTVEETRQAVNWVYDQGYGVFSYLGGESLAPLTTKEGLTFAEHTLEVVKHAKKKGMLVNVTTNGDYIQASGGGLIKSLQDSGLDSLTLSLHTYTKAGLRHLIDSARVTAEHNIIPTIQTVMTTQTADALPAIAAQAAKNGILFSLGLVQTQKDAFSKKQDISVIPTADKQEEIFKALRILKKHGFVRNNMNYLTSAPNHYPNKWLCDAEQDTFIKIGAGGKVNVCSSVETGLRLEDITALDDMRWRDKKREGVSNCSGCLFHCYYEVENPRIIEDIPTVAVGIGIKSGRHSIVEKWGQKAVSVAINRESNVNWDIESALI